MSKYIINSVIIIIGIVTILVVGARYVERAKDRARAGCISPLSIEYICKTDFFTYDHLHCFRYFNETDDRWLVIVNDEVVKMRRYPSDRKVKMILE